MKMVGPPGARRATEWGKKKYAGSVAEDLWRRLDSMELRVQRPKLVPDLLLGLARDLPAQPLPVRPEADRDRANVPVLVCREVDGILAMPAAPDRSVRHGTSVTLWLPVWLPGDRSGDPATPLTWWAQLGSNQ
jgi:hypothetical protein